MCGRLQDMDGVERRLYEGASPPGPRLGALSECSWSNGGNGDWAASSCAVAELSSRWQGWNKTKMLACVREWHCYFCSSARPCCALAHRSEVEYETLPQEQKKGSWIPGITSSTPRTSPASVPGFGGRQASTVRLEGWNSIEGPGLHSHEARQGKGVVVIRELRRLRTFRSGSGNWTSTCSTEARASPREGPRCSTISSGTGRSGCGSRGKKRPSCGSNTKTSARSALTRHPPSNGHHVERFSESATVPAPLPGMSSAEDRDREQKLRMRRHGVPF